MKKIVVILFGAVAMPFIAMAQSSIPMEAFDVNELSIQERLDLAQATFDAVAASSSFKDRFLAWAPGARKEGSRAESLKKLRQATWAMKEQLLKENNSQRFFILLRRYESELKAAAVLIGAGLVADGTRRAFKQRKESREKAEKERHAQHVKYKPEFADKYTTFSERRLKRLLTEGIVKRTARRAAASGQASEPREPVALPTGTPPPPRADQQPGYRSK